MALDELDAREPRLGLWLGLAAAVLVVGLAAGFVWWTLNSAAVKARLVEAVQRATGRTLTISGATGFELSLSPTVSMEDVALANPPGFSRPDMLKVHRLEVGLSLLGLLQHRIDIDHVTLVQPDILLEIDKAGRRNWELSREVSPALVPPPAQAPAMPPQAVPPSQAPANEAPEPAERRRVAVWLSNATMTDGHVGWLDAGSGHHYEVMVPRLALNAPAGGPAQLTGTVVYQGRAVELTGHAEPTEVAGSVPGTGPWPVDLKLVSGNASITVDGQVEQPLRGRGYTLAIDADLPEPAVLAPFFPKLPLASLMAVTAHAELSDSGGPNPTISVARLKVGSVDLGRFADGTTLADVTIGARGNAPITLAARVTRDGIDSGINGTFGDLGWLAAGASAPTTVDLEWHAGSARASVTGTIQEPSRFAGYALDVAVNVPKPSQVMNDAPPALRAVAFQTRLTDAPGAVPFQFTSSAGDVSGELAVTRLPKGSMARVSVEGQVSSQRLDLDTLLAHPSPAIPGRSGNAADVPAEPTSADGSAAAAPPSDANGQSGPVPDQPAPSQTAPTQKAQLIPDTKLPFDALRTVDANVKLAFADVRLDGVDIRNIAGVLADKDGLLRLDPFTITAPDQQLSGQMVADAARTPPLTHLALNAPAFAVQPLLGLLGLPQIASGSASVQADLSGTGDTPHAIAASLNGWAGVAIEGGHLDAKTVNAWLGEVQPLHLAGPDVTDLRCFALRADVKSGIATITPLAFNTPALIVDGHGDVDLGRETLQLQLRPRAKIGGTGIALPVELNGPIEAPSARIDITGKAFGGGALGGLLLGGKDIMGAAGGGDPCPAALAQARSAGATVPAAPGAKP